MSMKIGREGKGIKQLESTPTLHEGNLRKINWPKNQLQENMEDCFNLIITNIAWKIDEGKDMTKVIERGTKK